MRKIALIAYDLNPEIGSECREAFLWLTILAKHYKINAFVCDTHRQSLENIQQPNIHFTFIPVSSFLRKFASKTGLYFLPVSNFMQKIEHIFKDKTFCREFDLIHFLTPSGIHSFNRVYETVDVPYVIGPIGGALPTPDHFEKMFNFKERLVDKGRSFFYFLMKKNFSWKRYFNNAYRIVIATEYLFSVFPPEVKNKAVFLFDVVIDVDEFKEIKLQRRRHFIKIVYSGRLISTKGILMLIEAIRILKEKKMSVYSKLKILILGDGPLRRVVDRLIKKHGLDSSVQLIGKVSREKVINTLKESDIYCLPTIREPGGGSILEAMAAGLPIITSDYGGPKYSVTEDCGIKIKVSNYEQYVQDLVSAIIKLSSDEALRKKMGENARRRVEQEFSLDALEKKIIALYDEVLNEK